MKPFSACNAAVARDSPNVLGRGRNDNGRRDLNAASGYREHAVDVSGCAGQGVPVKFTGTETDAHGGTTSFVVDDTALRVS